MAKLQQAKIAVGFKVVLLGKRTALHQQWTILTKLLYRLCIYFSQKESLDFIGFIMLLLCVDDFLQLFCL